MAGTILYLPPPPSVNRTRRLHGPGYAALERWEKLADKDIMAGGGMKRLARITGPYQASIVFDENLVNLDLDNGLKSIIDYARRLDLVVDDDKKHFRRLIAEWGHAPSGCRLTLTEMST